MKKTVKELAELCQWKIWNQADSEKIGSGVYCGDLLSWVMAKCKEGDVWLTIMTNGNVGAVAELSSCAAVVLCESQEPDEILTEKAKKHGINLYGSSLSVYETAVKIHEAES